MVQTEHVRIWGYSGTWPAIGQSNVCGVAYYLMESDLSGKNISYIIMNGPDVGTSCQLAGEAVTKRRKIM